MSAPWAAQNAVRPQARLHRLLLPAAAPLIYLPLALTPYFVSLSCSTASGLAIYRVLRGYLPSLDAVTFLAFPAVFINAAHGQNGS